MDKRFIFQLKIIFQMIKYGLVSVIALVVDAGLLYILTEYMGINYLISATLSFICGLLVNYICCMAFVFKSKDINRLREFIFYSLIGLAGLLLNDLIIFIMVWFSVWYMVAKVVSTVIVFFFNFFLRRRLFENKVRSEESI